jgi:RecA-family ATPase
MSTDTGTQPSATAQGVLSRMRWLEVGILSKAPPPRAWLLRNPELDANVLPLGEAGFVAGAGGTSKTFAMISLAISVALARPWLDTYSVEHSGRVALFLAEENASECHRRLDSVARSMGLTEDEKRLVERSVLCVPLMGLTCNLITGSESTDVAGAIFRQLEAEAAGEPWRLIVFDALSRFAGVETETSNAAAASFLKVVEKFTTLPGNPTVAVVHHSNQASRTPGLVVGTTAMRGVTALGDNARWVMMLSADDSGLVTLKLTKSNYGPHHPQLPELQLCRREHGVLSPASADEVADALASSPSQAVSRKEAAHADEDLGLKIMGEVRKHPGRYPSANKLAEAVGGTRSTVLAKIKQLLQSGRLVMGSTGFEVCALKVAA